MTGERVREVERRWYELPAEVREAVLTCRVYEEGTAANLSLLSDPVRGFIRQSGGTASLKAETG